MIIIVVMEIWWTTFDLLKILQNVQNNVRSVGIYTIQNYVDWNILFFSHLLRPSKYSFYLRIENNLASYRG